MRGGIVSYAVDGSSTSWWRAVGNLRGDPDAALLPQLEKVPAASTLIAFKVSITLEHDPKSGSQFSEKIMLHQ
jgi:hypothetical protein